MNKNLARVCAALLVSSCMPAFADGLDGIELAAGHARADLDRTTPAASFDAQGWTLAFDARKAIAGPLFAQAEITHASTKADAAPARIGATQERASLGAALPLDGGQAYVRAGFARLDLNLVSPTGRRDSSEGYAVHGGLDAQLAPWASINGEVGYIGLSDWRGPEATLALRFKAGPVWLGPSARVTRLSDNGGVGPKNRYKSEEVRLALWVPVTP